MLKIYNSITKKKEEFVPLKQGYVGMYVCGPTVYGMPHLGHAKSYTNFDLVYRYLMYLGYKVKYVQNITDVGHLVGDSDQGEDKVSKQAKLENLDAYEIAYKYEVEYFKAMDQLNNLRPSISCRATGHINEMIAMINTIMDKGYAYLSDKGNVYFRVQKFIEYGKLANRKLENTKSGERINVQDDKENPSDFALWKKAEPNALMKWQSPWGEGVPGWHIECSAMSKKYLGATFDIHGGGIDNIFPHHDCEIAQSEVANGTNYVNYFMHNNLVTVNGTKMGKSLGNFITLSSLFEKYSPLAVRFFLLQFHYRSAVDFTQDKLELASEQWNKLNSAISQIKSMTNLLADITDDQLLQIHNSILASMDEDFNSSLAMSEIYKLVKISQSVVNDNDINMAKQINALSVMISDIFGLSFQIVDNKDNQISEQIKQLANVRWQAKVEKDWAKADELRKKINSLGYDILDSKDSYEIKKI